MKGTTRLVAMIGSAGLLVGCPSSENAPGPGAGVGSQSSANVAPTKPYRGFGDLMTYYYLDPAPDEVPRVIREVSAQGAWNEPFAVAPLVSYFAHLFAAHPDRTDEWVQETESLPAAHRLFMCRALHMSDTPEARAALERMLDRAAPEEQAEINAIIDSEPVRLLDHEPDSPATLDMIWAAFFVTGEKRYVEHICSVFAWAPETIDEDGDQTRRKVWGAARWSVTSNIRQHEAVRRICVELESAAEGHARDVLRQILAKADAEG